MGVILAALALGLGTGFYAAGYFDTPDPVNPNIAANPDVAVVDPVAGGDSEISLLQWIEDTGNHINRENKE